MLTVHTMLADTILLTGNLFGYHFVLTLSQLIYWLIAAVVGLVAETIVGWRLPFGIIGAFIAALIGIWLFTNVVQVNIPDDPNVYGVPLVKTLIGAVVFVVIWHLITYRAAPRRRTA
jgi:uncharacterized membrane protein YeaQ/YmgE (transglycosylase-associated protein family)